jgi:hypothetical protein
MGIELVTYDLHLPESFSPVPCDGEVHEFFLWDFEQVKIHLLAEEFTPEVEVLNHRYHN